MNGIMGELQFEFQPKKSILSDPLQIDKYWSELEHNGSEHQQFTECSYEEVLYRILLNSEYLRKFTG
jgi:hypothetical protein